MSDRPEAGAEVGTRGIYTGAEPNPVLTFLQRPRIVLLMLAVWSLLGTLTEFFTQNSVFLDNHDLEMDGAIGGFAFGWEGIPLAVLYVYCFRNPDRFGRIFWLAMIHMGSLAASQLYHLGTGDFSFESIVVPLAGSLALGAFSFVNVFKARDEEEVAAQRRPD